MILKNLLKGFKATGLTADSTILLLQDLSLHTGKNILVSTETGEVLDSGIEEELFRSEVNYSTYAGNYNNLYPGTWNLRFQDSSSDRVYTARNRVNNFRSDFTANKNMRASSELRMDALKSIGSSVAKKVFDFNPEK